jgi:hypothetical protein
MAAKPVKPALRPASSFRRSTSSIRPARSGTAVIATKRNC